MKKLLFIATMLLLPLIVNAQKIDKDYIDQFTGKRIMFTKPEKLNWGYKGKVIGGKMQLRFCLNDKFQYAVLHWYCNNYIEVPANAKILFKLDNGHTITLKNESHTPATQGGTALSKKDVGVQLNCIGKEISQFSTAFITTIRIHTNQGYFDFEIDRKDAVKIHKQFMLFSRVVNVGMY